MPFVQAKCPMCGGMLAVDDSKKAAVCQFCGEAFIVEEAVNNYITNNITNNTVNNNIGDGAVVNVYEQTKSVSALLQRVAQFLEEKDWENANAYCDDILDIDPQNAQAYLGKLMAELHVPKKRDLVRHKSFENSVNYQCALKYGDKSMQDELKEYLTESKNKKLNQEMIKKYKEAEENYQKDYKIWEEQVASIKRDWKNKADDKLSVEKEALLADIESKFFKTKNPLSEKLQELNGEKAKIELTLKELGFFALSEKKKAKEYISELDIQIEKVKQQLKIAQQEFAAEKEDLESWEEERREQLLASMKDEYSLPPKPEQTPIVLDDGTIINAAQLKNECIMDTILGAMRPGTLYEREDLQKIASSIEKMGIQRVAAISNSMVERGYLQRVTEQGEVYFKLR